MTPEQKLKLLVHLQTSAWRLKFSGLLMQNPHMSENEIKRKVRELFLNART